MRPLILTAVVLTVLAGTAACGDADSDPGDASSSVPTAAEPASPEADPGADPGAPDDSVGTTQDDVERIAVRLEQVFAGSTYPRDLAGAIAAARENDLEPTAGNTIGGYAYDADAREFTLCVESSTGAYAVYDTEPMSGRAAGSSGGCP